MQVLQPPSASLSLLFNFFHKPDFLRKNSDKIQPKDTSPATKLETRKNSIPEVTKGSIIGTQDQNKGIET